MKKFLSLLLVMVMVLSLVACGDNTNNPVQGSGDNKPGKTPVQNVSASDIEESDFTYYSYSSSLGNNWNPHTWETNGDSSIMSYIETPLVDMQILDSENGVYQWVYAAATYVNDVTAEHQDDLEKYEVNLPAGQSVADTTSGFVFEIGLRENMKWADGTPINADTYIYSMEQLLNPDMKNYRANLYYAGESAVAGGAAYYYQGESSFLPFDSVGMGYEEFIAAGHTDDEVYVNMAGFWGVESPDGTGFAPITDDTMMRDPAVPEGEDEDYVSAKYLWDNYLGPNGYYAGSGYDTAYTGTTKSYPAGVSYDDTVGCYKVDDYTIRYVNESQIDINYFFTSLTSNWLVYEPYYEAGKDTSGTLVTTDYNTKKENTMSYGPYVIDSIQPDRQIVYVQNPEWYGYQTTDSGYLYSITEYEVDGANIQRYKTTKIVIDVMTDDAAKEAFLKGELDDWAPPADEIVNYAASTQLYKVDETYTQSFFFCTGLDALKTMDASKGNQNSVVMSNVKFRKAFSLSIDRADWVLSTAGYKPAYSLMNSLYHYDIYNDPTSSYRSSEEAMQAICNLYEVEYGDGTPYATLKEAYESITGYNLTEAKQLMAEACAELVADGLYTEGQPIHIRIGYKKGALDSSDQSAVAKMNAYINAAAEGSGFGTITLEAIDNIDDRYGDVSRGEFAIGYGAWGGAAFYPFRNMQVYCDTDQYSIHEAGCWDPANTNLTINVKGEDVTMSWKDWSQALVGSGPYANEGFDVKLAVTAKMEEEYLKFYYRIPIASTTAASLLSYKMSYYTEDYNIMYGFGGLELLQYNYNDAEWADYVASQGGTLSYE